MAKPKEYILRYEAKKLVATLNSIISPWKWRTTKEYYRREFIELLKESKVRKVKEFALEVSFNTKHDCDNMVPVAKFFIDTFRELGFVENDTNVHYKYLKLFFDGELPKQTVEFKIIKLK